MRSEGNFYHPIPEKVPKVRNAVEFEHMKTSPAGRSRPIRVSYSDVGCSSDDSKDPSIVGSSPPDVPVILWASGMFGGRYHGFAFDDLCKKHRVRFLAIDRPGIGGTDLVSLELRVKTWLEIVPAVLQHAGVKQVHLAAHSAGIIYVINAILHLRHLLHPTKPFCSMFGPWVHPSKSGRLGLSAVGLLPEFAIGTWHHWAKLTSSTIAPILTAAGISATKAFKASPTSPISNNQIVEDSSIGDCTETTWRRASEAVIANFIYAEKLEGASQEALLCLRKGTATWGDWHEIDEVILRIVENEKKRIVASGIEERAADKIQVQIYFAEHDEMTGRSGQKWLESCFTQPGVAERISLESQVVGGSDHNDVLSLQSGAMENMIKSVSRLYGVPDSSAANATEME